MPVELVAESTIIVGKPMTLEGPSPLAKFGVLFEDIADRLSLRTDFANEENPDRRCNAHLANVAQVADRPSHRKVQLVWSTDGLKAALLINKYPHAIFDFAARRGYCRTGFPPADERWTDFDHSRDDLAIELFR